MIPELILIAAEVFSTGYINIIPPQGLRLSLQPIKAFFDVRSDLLNSTRIRQTWIVRIRRLPW